MLASPRSFDTGQGVNRVRSFNQPSDLLLAITLVSGGVKCGSPNRVRGVICCHLRCKPCFSKTAETYETEVPVCMSNVKPWPRIETVRGFLPSA